MCFVAAIHLSLSTEIRWNVRIFLLLSFGESAFFLTTLTFHLKCRLLCHWNVFIVANTRYFVSFDSEICCYSLQYVEENTYGYNGNEEIKLAAATVYVSTLLTYPHSANTILGDIVHQTYLNESLLRKLGQSMQEFYFDHKKRWNFSVFHFEFTAIEILCELFNSTT